jgi:hypothetical protein
MVSRLCASYEGIRDIKTEKEIAEIITKQLRTNSGLITPRAHAAA